MTDCNDYKRNLDYRVAQDVGVNAALLYWHIAYWVAFNRNDNKNFKNGRFWTFSTARGLCKQYPFMSEKQIRTALSKLEDGGYIITGSFNKMQADRTKWYGDLKSEPQNTACAPEGSPCAPEGSSGASPEVTAIPNTKQILQKDMYDFEDQVQEKKPDDLIGEFAEWWKNEYPERGPHSRLKAWEAYARHRKTVTKEQIWNATLAYFNQLLEDETPPKFVKMASSFLNSEPWSN